MSERQTSLALDTAPADPNLAWMEGMLKGAACWMTAADIKLSTGGRLNDRDIRELASASQWLISGQKGYKHIEHATGEEIHHAAAWLESQAKKMSERACLIRKNGHKILG